MTAPPFRAGRSPRALRRAVVAVTLAAAVAVTAWLASPGTGEGPPLSPDSVAADGTRALVQTLERIGARVVVDATPPPEATTGLLLHDNLDEADREAWRRIADDGGTLLVVDPDSPLAPPVAGDTTFGFFETPVARGCDVAALAEVQRVQTAGGLTYELGDGASGCFARGDGHWLVLQPSGDGVVVVAGGPQFIMNATIGEADNAVLAVALLAPRPGAVVAIAPPRFAAAGTQVGLVDLVPDAAWLFMAQLLIAFAVLILWRARRLGAPVVEEAPVSLPGSELVLGVGALYERSDAAEHAAALLRDEACRAVAGRLRLGDAAPDAVAARAEDAGVPRGFVEQVFREPLPSDADGLVRFAGAVERVRTTLDRLDDRSEDRYFTGREEGAARV